MGYFTEAEKRGHPSSLSGSDLEAWLIHGASSGGPSSGVAVDQSSALSSTAMLQGLRILSGSVAMVPFGVFRRTNPGREIVRDHPAHRVLQDPNPEITAIELRQMVTSFAASAGNGYAQIVFDGAGRPRELWPIPPHRISPERTPGGKLFYMVQPKNGAAVPLPMEEVFHLRGFMRGGLLGVDTIRKLQESVGLTLATERYAASFFGNGTMLSGWLKHPGRPSQETKKNIRESFNRDNTGLTKAHRVGFLEEGLDWVSTGVAPEQSQLIETRRFSIEEVARALNVPPHLLHHLERATFNNIEHLGISFVIYSLGEWYTRWEQTAAKRLLLPSERASGHYTKHNPAGLLRGDHASRSQFYQALYTLGVLSPNDIRELEDLNPIEGGDRYFVRRDTIPLDAVDELVASLNPDPTGGGFRQEQPALPPEARRALPSTEERDRRTVDNRRKLRRDFAPLFEEAAASTVRKEAVAVRAALGKAFGGRDAATLRQLVDEFYQDHDGWVADRFASLFRSYGRRVASEAAEEGGGDVPDDIDEFMAEYAETFGREWTGSSAGQIRQLIRESDPDELEEVIDTRLTEWEERRPQKTAERQTVESGEAITAMVYAAVGVIVLRWASFGESCPLCEAMNGRTVAIEGSFMKAGETLDVDDEDTPPLTSKRNIGHPPLHGGCDCAVLPG